MSIPLNVLLVEDSEDDAELMLYNLRKGGYAPASRRVDTRAALRQALDGQTWDVILSDYAMPEFNGLDALNICCEKDPDLPFIIISGAIGEDTAVKVMKAGANDYLMKDHLARLVPAIERELREAETRRARRQAEAALRESDLRLREAQALAEVGNWSLDLASGEVDCSEEACRIFEFSPCQVTHDDILGLIAPKDRQPYLELHRAAVEKGTEYDLDLSLNLPSRTERWVHLRARPIRGVDGKVERLFGTVMNITVRKQLEDNFLAAQKMADLGTLAAGVAHEINTPLQVITGASESLLRDFKDESSVDLERARRRLDMIHRNAWRVAEIVRALLTYARTSPEEYKETHLNVIVQDALLLVEHQLRSWSNIELTTDLAPNLPRLACDHNRMIQVIINLINNAREAMTGGGRIRIATRYDPQKDRLLLEVTDNGAGIPRSIMERIFEPFFTTKPIGTGLGLPIVKGIIDAHRGEISVESVEEMGTRLTIALPRQAVQPPPSNSV